MVVCNDIRSVVYDPVTDVVTLEIGYDRLQIEAWRTGEEPYYLKEVKEGFVTIYLTLDQLSCMIEFIMEKLKGLLPYGKLDNERPKETN